MKILSLSSSVAHGHVGNSALVAPLHRLGFEVTAIDTVQFSNHPGHGGYGGDVFSPAHVGGLIDGLARAGFLGGHDGVLSGYLGDADNGAALLWAIAANPGAVYLCDPVMGDDGRSYVRPGIMDFLCGPALAAAHVVTPNRFELEALSGQPVHGVDGAIAAARTLLARGPRLVVITSLEIGTGLGCAAVTEKGAWIVATPRLDFPQAVHGAGDMLAGLILAGHLHGQDTAHLLETAMARLYTVLELTHQQGRAELALIAALEKLGNPPHRFTAQSY